MNRSLLLCALGMTVLACSETAPVAEEVVEEEHTTTVKETYTFSDDSTFEPIGPASEGDDNTSDVAAISDDGVIFRFVGPFEGGNALAAEDDFSAHLQAREISVRAQDISASSFDDVTPLYREDVLAWSAEQKSALTAVISDLVPFLNQIDQHLPDEVLLVRTGVVVEGGLPHTRGNAIIFAGGEIPLPGPGDEEARALQSLFLHELHHVMSRANGDQHDAYYSIIGFEPCSFDEPAGLEAARLTNPDAPTYRHYAPLNLSGADGVIPFLYVIRGFSADAPSSLPDVFGFGLVPVRYADGVCTATVSETADLLEPQEVPALFERIGQNTDYIIHPEETLADNFVYWAQGNLELPDPEIPEAIGTFWLRPAE